MEFSPFTLDDDQIKSPQNLTFLPVVIRVKNHHKFLSYLEKKDSN